APFVEPYVQIELRQKIDGNYVTLVPVEGGLQTGRAAQPPVRKENVFSKGGFVAAHQGVHRHAGKLCQLLELTLGENKAVERGCRLDDFQPELSGEIVTKCGGTGLRDGQPARSNHKRVASVVSLVSVEYETLVFAYATNAALQSKLGSGLTA